MTRCVPWVSVAATVVAPLLALTLALPAAAQTARKFPATALRGEIVITQPPQLVLNGQPAQLAPGARIRGADNLLHLSGTLVGRKLPVNYTLDPMGNLLDVWVLTPAERAVQPWPQTPAQAAAWRFNADAQTWSER